MPPSSTPSDAAASADQETGARPPLAADERRMAARTRWKLALSGFVLTWVTWVAFNRLVGNPLLLRFWETMPPVVALLGAGIGVTRFRPLLWGWAGLVTVAWLVIAYTPLIAGSVRSL